MGATAPQAERAPGALEALVEVRALVATEELLEERLAAAVATARSAGVDSLSLAAALGVHRATLYRRFPVGVEAG